MRSSWGVGTLTLATTDSAARRAGVGEGAGTEGKGTRRLPDKDAAKEWAPASAGEASMAHLCDAALHLPSVSRTTASLVTALSYPLCSV
jgi:hypothetical protein